MKKTPFIILLSVEFLAALISMGLMFSDLGAFIYLIASVLFSAVLLPFFLALRKATDEKKKEKLRGIMLLLMLIPTVIALILVAVVIIGLLTYFG